MMEVTAFFLFIVAPLGLLALAIVGVLWLVRHATRQVVRGIFDQLEDIHPPPHRQHHTNHLPKQV